MIHNHTERCNCTFCRQGYDCDECNVYSKNPPFNQHMKRYHPKPGPPHSLGLDAFFGESEPNESTLQNFLEGDPDRQVQDAPMVQQIRLCKQGDQQE